MRCGLVQGMLLHMNVHFPSYSFCGSCFRREREHAGALGGRRFLCAGTWIVKGEAVTWAFPRLCEKQTGF